MFSLKLSLNKYGLVKILLIINFYLIKINNKTNHDITIFQNLI